MVQWSKFGRPQFPRELKYELRPVGRSTRQLINAKNKVLVRLGRRMVKRSKAKISGKGHEFRIGKIPVSGIRCSISSACKLSEWKE